MIKLRKYLEVGVREYWTIDPDKHRVVVYKLGDEYSTPEIYTFDDVIPVGIFDNSCEIDMRTVYEEVAFLEE